MIAGLLTFRFVPLNEGKKVSSKTYAMKDVGRGFTRTWVFSLRMNGISSW